MSSIATCLMMPYPAQPPTHRHMNSPDGGTHVRRAWPNAVVREQESP
jgi:hypothetical protein